jgi:hypothetical protein
MDPRVEPEDDEDGAAFANRRCWRLDAHVVALVILGLDPRIHAVTASLGDALIMVRRDIPQLIQLPPSTL